MKLSKRAVLGLATVTTVASIGGAGMVWLPRQTDEAPPQATAPSADETAEDAERPTRSPIATPLPDSAETLAGDSVPMNPIRQPLRQPEFDVPSPMDTVVRGNDDISVSISDADESDVPAPPSFTSETASSISDAGTGQSTLTEPPAAPAFNPYSGDGGGSRYGAAADASAETSPANGSSTAGAPAVFNPNPPAANAPLPNAPQFGQQDPAQVQPPQSTPPANQVYSEPISDRSPSVGFGTAGDGRYQPADPGNRFGTPSAVEPSASFPHQSRTPLQALSSPNTSLLNPNPGPRRLEGPQQPAIRVEKLAPEEIQVNIPATFEILVQNTGEATAHGVQLVDQVPQGTRLIETAPPASQGANGEVIWQLGDLDPGEEVIVSLDLLPLSEGEIGSVAQVSFQSQASVRTTCTRPQLTVEHSAPSRVLIGEEVIFAITIKNPGSGDATNVVIEEDVPTGLVHAAGQAIEYEIGTLRAGEEVQLELLLQADQPGVLENVIRVRGNGELVAEDRLQMEVISPELQVGVRGPARRFLERQVSYDILFANPGTAPATNMDLVAYLPKGLEFVSADNKGKYDLQSHAVYWSLEQLPPSQNGQVQLTALPVETGEQQLRIEAEADLSLVQQYDHTTVVEALTELEFTVNDLQDPIEVGSETTYEIRITNRGSKAATNVRLAAVLPPQVVPIDADGATRVAVNGQQIIAEPIDQLGPQDEAFYRIKVQGQQPGDHLINVQLVSDDVPTPVTKQESTKVYADR